MVIPMREKLRHIDVRGETPISRDIQIVTDGNEVRHELLRWGENDDSSLLVCKLMDQLAEANFLTGYVRALNSGLEPDGLYLTAARWLFDFLHYNLLVFDPPTGQGRPRVFASIRTDSCREEILFLLKGFNGVSLADVQGYESLGLERHKPGGGFNRVLCHNLPDGGGSITFFWGEEGCRQLSSHFISYMGESFSQAMENSISLARQRDLSMRDPLTGLFNRRIFEEMLDIEGARREPVPMAIALIDIDDFKRINDTYGHQAGDTVLAGFGDFLRRSCRRADLVARYGGEEFALLLTTNSVNGTLDFMEKTLQRLSEKRFRMFGGGSIRVTASIGIAQSRCGSGCDPRELLRRADLALYRAKHGGKNRVCSADPPPAVKIVPRSGMTREPVMLAA